MKKFMRAATATILTMAMLFIAGCGKESDNGGGGNSGGNGDNGGGSGGGTTEGMYVGIIGFNDVLKTKEIGLLNGNTEQDFIGFVENLSCDDNTALYYAVNKALDWFRNATLPSDLINVSLLTFTDGLDNASLMLDGSYDSQSAYLDAVNNRIKTEKVHGLSINAHAIGLKGQNVSDETAFRQTLLKLSSGEANMYIDDDMDLVIQRFRDIANQLYNEITTVNANVKIPGGYDNNTTIRLSFDNVMDANNSSHYIQAVFSRVDGKGRLSNVEYHGLYSTSGSSVVSTRQDGASYWYTFSNVKAPDANGLPISNLDNMKLWIYNNSTMDWRPEDEFTPSSYSNVSVTQKSAVAILVLDCTTSLGGDFRKMKDAAEEFIRTLNDNSGGNSGGGDQSYTISVTANPSNGGMVLGGGTYANGTSCTLTAVPNSGYSFTNWTENGSYVSSNSSIAFVVNSDRSLVANFSMDTPSYTNLVLNELNGGVDGKFIEIYNRGYQDLSMEGMYIEKDNNDYPIWTGDASIVVPARGYLVLYSEDVMADHPELDESYFFASGLSSKKTLRVALYTPDGTERDLFTRGSANEGEWGYVISNVSPKSYARTPDGGEWKLADPTPGAANPYDGEEIPQE